MFRINTGYSLIKMKEAFNHGTLKMPFNIRGDCRNYKMSFNVLYSGAGKKLFQVTCENVTGDPVKKSNTLLRSFKDIEILTNIACGTQQIKFVLVCEQ